MSYLSYISDDDLENAVQIVVNCIRQVQAKPATSIYKNVIDPFSAIFDGVVEGTSFADWLNKEKIRQNQKTVQNAIGEFHQSIIGSIPGWQNLKTGKNIDVCNLNLNIIAEIKNKHNTVKGSDRTVIYDTLLYTLQLPDYQGFTAYYVEIIPKKDRNNIFYNRPFTPSDNKTKMKRPQNSSILIIDGCSFYDLATGVPKSLHMLFDVLPDVISKVAGVRGVSKAEKAKFKQLFDRAY
jgi:hypothetical protein